MSPCQSCAASTGDGASLCRLCGDGLATDVRSIGWLVDELEVTRTRQARFIRDQEGSPAANTPLPWDERASSMLVTLRSAVSYWCHMISLVDEDPRDPLSGIADSTPELAGWLTRNLVTLRRMAPAGEAYRDLRATVHRARVVVDRPPELVSFGICDNDDGGTRVPCDAYLYAEPDPVVVSCRKCGAVHDVAARKLWMLAYVNEGMQGTATEVAAYLRLAGMKVTTDAIHAMKRRGRITPVSSIPSRTGRAQPVQIFAFRHVIEAVGRRYVRDNSLHGDEN